MLKFSFILLLLPIISFTAKAEEVIHLSSGEWPPYISEKLAYYGFVSRIVSEAFALQGIKVEYDFRPWKRSYKEALMGKYDGSLIWSKNSEREKNFYYSDEVITGQSVFFHNKSCPFNWNTEQDLVGLKVGGTLGYKYQLLEELEKRGALTINRVSSDQQSFHMLLYKRIDVIQLDLEAGFDLLNESFTANEVSQITYNPKAILIDHYHLILSKKNKHNQDLVALFNKGLAQLKKSGEYDRYISESRQGKYKR